MSGLVDKYHTYGSQDVLVSRCQTTFYSAFSATAEKLSGYAGVDDLVLICE